MPPGVRARLGDPEAVLSLDPKASDGGDGGGITSGSALVLAVHGEGSLSSRCCRPRIVLVMSSRERACAEELEDERLRFQLRMEHIERQAQGKRSVRVLRGSRSP